MMRRNLLAMLGLAPVAAAGAAPKMVATANIPYPSGLGWGASEAMSSAGHDMSPLEYAKRQLAVAKWRRAQAAGGGISPYLPPVHIEARRATSPAIKALLTADWHRDRDLREAEGRVSWEMAKMAAPAWLKDWL